MSQAGFVIRSGAIDERELLEVELRRFLTQDVPCSPSVSLIFKRQALELALPLDSEHPLCSFMRNWPIFWPRALTEDSTSDIHAE